MLTVPNAAIMLVARWAAHRCGATVVHVRSMNPRTDEVELPTDVQAEVLHATRPVVLLTDASSASRARRLGELVPGTTVALLDVAEPVREHPLPPMSRPKPWRWWTSPAALTVEAAPDSWRSPGLHASAWWLVSGEDADAARPARFLSVTPISHTTAPMIDAALLGGGSVVLHPGFDVDAVLSAVTDQGVSDLYLAVPHLLALLDEPRLLEVDLTGLRRVVYSGTPSSPWRVRQAVESFGGSLVQVYGATETGGISALTPEDHLEPELHGTVGRPFPWVEVEIRDEDGDRLPPGRTGEVVVRSETVMSGYLGPTPIAGPAGRRLGPHRRPGPGTGTAIWSCWAVWAA